MVLGAASSSSQGGVAANPLGPPPAGQSQEMVRQEESTAAELRGPAGASEQVWDLAVPDGYPRTPLGQEESAAMIGNRGEIAVEPHYYPVEVRPFEATVGPPIYFPRVEPDAQGTSSAFQMMGPAEVQHQKALILDEKRWFTPDEGEIFGDYVA